jgi:hypothetical protein
MEQQDKEWERESRSKEERSTTTLYIGDWGKHPLGRRRLLEGASNLFPHHVSGSSTHPLNPHQKSTQVLFNWVDFQLNEITLKSLIKYFYLFNIFLIHSIN